MVSYQSVQPDLWPLTLMRHFPPRNFCSLDIFSFWNRYQWSLEMVVMMWISQYIYLQLVKCSDCQWSTSITMFTTFKITFVPFRHPPPLHELLLLQVVLTTSTCLNALGCCRVVMFVCFFLTLDSSRGKEGNAPVNHNLYCQHRTVHRANCDSRAMTSRVGDGSPVTGWVMPSHRIDKG